MSPEDDCILALHAYQRRLTQLLEYVDLQLEPLAPEIMRVFLTLSDACGQIRALDARLSKTRYAQLIPSRATRDREAASRGG